MHHLDWILSMQKGIMAIAPSQGPIDVGNAKDDRFPRGSWISFHVADVNKSDGFWNIVWSAWLIPDRIPRRGDPLVQAVELMNPDY